MNDQEMKSPYTDDSPSSDEYGFDARRDPIHKDEEQAEASQYGIYGYQDEAGEAYEGEPPEEGASPPADDADDAVAVEKPEQGGQAWDETEHGAGFAQPMEEPQRSASHSDHPAEEE